MNKPVTAERLYDNDGRPYSTLYEAHIDIGDICMVWAPPGKWGFRNTTPGRR